MFRQDPSKLSPRALVSNALEALEAMRADVMDIIHDLTGLGLGRVESQTWRLKAAIRSIAQLSGLVSPWAATGNMNYRGEIAFSSLGALLYGLTFNGGSLGMTNYQNPYTQLGTSRLKLVMSSSLISFQIVTHAGHILWDSTVNTLAQLAGVEDFVHTTGLTLDELKSIDQDIPKERMSYDKLAKLLTEKLALEPDEYDHPRPAFHAEELVTKPQVTSVITPLAAAVSELPDQTTTSDAEGVVAAISGDTNLSRRSADEDDDIEGFHGYYCD